MKLRVANGCKIDQNQVKGSASVSTHERVDQVMTRCSNWTSAMPFCIYWCGEAEYASPKPCWREQAQAPSVALWEHWPSAFLCRAVGRVGQAVLHPSLGSALAVASPPHCRGPPPQGPGGTGSLGSAPPRLGRPRAPTAPVPLLRSRAPNPAAGTSGKKRCPGSCKFLILPSYFCDERYIQRGWPFPSSSPAPVKRSASMQRTRVRFGSWSEPRVTFHETGKVKVLSHGLASTEWKQQNF